jgi:hypothetical protein
MSVSRWRRCWRAAEGLEADGESAATQHRSLAATSMGYGAVFVEVGAMSNSAKSGSGGSAALSPQARSSIPYLRKASTLAA